MAYLLDANVFIMAQNDHYGFQTCPGFWEWLLQANCDSKVHSIVKVKQELQGREDDLSQWARYDGSNLFLPIRGDISRSYSVVSNWVSRGGRHYKQSSINDFLGKADYFLIAQAHEGDYTVVTREVSSPQSQTKIKIPDVCRGIRVECITPHKMLIREGARFVMVNPAAAGNV